MVNASKYFGDFAGLLVVAEDVSDEQIENYLACKDTSEMQRKSILKGFNKTENISMTEILQTDVCNDVKETDMKLFEMKRGGIEGRNLCLGLDGIFHSGSSSYTEVLEHGKKQGCSFIWVPIHYDKDKREWVGDADYVPTNNMMWSRNYPKKIELRQCANLNVATGNLENERCEVEQCHFCYLGRTTHFNLYGICKDSIIDQSYTLHVDQVTKKIEWKGFGKTNLVKNKDSKQWEIVQVHEPFEIIGRTLQDAPKDEFFPIGVNKWEIFNDTCIGLKNIAEKDLLLTRCDENQFACSDSSCVDLEKRCDLFPDCDDKSDETDCRVLSISGETYKGYEINFPTLPSKNEQINLNVSINIEQIVNVKDLDLKFVAKLTLKIKWFDVQLSWINLKNESTRNFLSEKEIGMIWQPKIQFGNSENISPIAIDNSAVIYVEKTNAGKSKIYPAEKRRAMYYDGSENPLVYSRIYQEEFFCNFEYSWFPFDTQNCYLSLTTFNSMQESVNLIPQEVNYTGDKDLMVFSVLDYYFENNNTATDRVILRIK